MESQTSNQLTRRFLEGDPQVSLRDIELACARERFNYLWNKGSLGKNWLKPISLLPVVLYFLIWE